MAWSWVQQVMEERGKQGLCAGVRLWLTSLSGLFSGFCMGFFFADLVWFLNRLVYIFSAKFCKWKKTNKPDLKQNARREESAVFMGNKRILSCFSRSAFWPKKCIFTSLSLSDSTLQTEHF